VMNPLLSRVLWITGRDFHVRKVSARNSKHFW